MATFGDYADAAVEAAHEALCDPNGRGRLWRTATVVIAKPGEHVSGENLIVVGPNVKGRLSKSFVISPNADVVVRKSVVVGNNARVRSRGGNVVKGRAATVIKPSKKVATKHPDRHVRADVERRDTFKAKVKKTKPAKRVGKKTARK